MQVGFGAADAESARAALRCHRSQFTPAVMQQASDGLERAWDGRVSLQPCSERRAEQNFSRQEQRHDDARLGRGGALLRARRSWSRSSSRGAPGPGRAQAATSSPDATPAGSSSARRCSRRTSARSTSSGSRERAPLPASRSPSSRSWPGSCCCCSAGSSCPSTCRSGVFTMPEFLERRYSSGPRMYLAIVSIVSYVLTKISVTIAAGGIVFEALMGINFWTGATIVVLATGVYTLFGGLKAVLYTDAMQMFVLLIGAIVVTILGLQAIGGWDALVAAVGPERFDLWQPSSHPDFPVDGHPVRRADPRRLVLVHGPVHRPAGAGGQGPGRGAPRRHLRRLRQAAAALHLRAARDHRLRARRVRPAPPREPGPGADRPHGPAAARGTSRRRDRGPARGAHELAVVGLQLQRHARDDGPLQALAAGRDASGSSSRPGSWRRSCWCCSGSRGSRS